MSEGLAPVKKKHANRPLSRPAVPTRQNAGAEKRAVLPTVAAVLPIIHWPGIIAVAGTAQEDKEETIALIARDPGDFIY